MKHNIDIKELEDRVDLIYSILGESLDTTDYNDLLLATGKMLADAEFALATKKAEALNKILKEKPTMSANEQKVQVESRCADVARVARKVEQLNRALGIIIANKRS